LSLAAIAYASPFLVCNPYPAGLDQATMPTSFVIKGLTANPVSTLATTNPDGTIQLHYDLSQLGHGSYTVVVDAVNALGGISPDSAPFLFVLGVPVVPTNIRITP
jgi:hypothetical protein